MEMSPHTSTPKGPTGRARAVGTKAGLFVAAVFATLMASLWPRLESSHTTPVPIRDADACRAVVDRALVECRDNREEALGFGCRFLEQAQASLLSGRPFAVDGEGFPPAHAGTVCSAAYHVFD